MITKADKPAHITKKSGRLQDFITKSCQQNEPKYVMLMNNHGKPILSPTHYKGIKFVADYYKTHKVMPTAEVFQDNPEYLDYWTTTPNSTTISYDYNNIWQENAVRQASSVLNELRELTGTGTIAKFDDFVHKFRTSVPPEEEPPVDVYDINWDYMFDTTKNDGLLTGLPLLDNISHGLYPKEMAAIVGFTNVGKTWVMAFMAACQLLQGKFIVFVSGEMTKEDIFARTLGFVTNTSPSILRDKSDKNKIKLARLKFTGKIQELKKNGSLFYIFDGEGYSAESLSKQVKELEDKHDRKVDFVFVDGIYLMKTNSGNAGDGWEVQSEIAQEYAMQTRNSNWRLICSTQLKSNTDGDMNISLSSVGKTIAYSQNTTFMVGAIKDVDNVSLAASSSGSLPCMIYKVLKSRHSEVGGMDSVSMDYENMIWASYGAGTGKDLIKEISDAVPVVQPTS